MMKITSLLQKVFLAVHGLINRSVTWSRVYFYFLGSILRRFPDGPFKHRALQSLRAVQWPLFPLAARKVDVGGISLKIVPHFGEFDFDVFLLHSLTYESETFAYMKSLEKNYDAIVEIGANVGVFTLFLATHFKNATVFAFEPSRKAYLRLLENIRLNSLSNCYPFNAAVSNQMGVVSFFEPARHLVNGSLIRQFAEIFSDQISETKALSVDGTFLEKMLKEFGRVLIKIDAEGADVEVLKTLMGFIREKKPDILIECLDITENDLNALNMSETYIFYELTTEGPLLCQRFKAKKEETTNFFLTPK